MRWEEGPPSEVQGREGQRDGGREHHRRLPLTPRKPSTLASQYPQGSTSQLRPGNNLLNVANVSQMGSISQQKSPSLLHPASTPQSHISFGVVSNVTSNVASERNERDHFTKNGHNPNYAGYNGYALQNGTYSSHPNLLQVHT